MRKMKYLVGILLLFIAIGFATVTVSLSITGNAKILSDIDDFKVYFSDAKLDNEQDLSLVQSETELSFDLSFSSLGDSRVITYDVTNASKVFDAALTISCSQGDEIFSVVNVFDTTTNLVALGTRSGTLTMKKLKANDSESAKNYSVTCTLNATPIERTEVETGEVPGPIVNPYPVGMEIALGTENFNVISSTKDSVTMLAQYNLGTDYKQRSSQRDAVFSSVNGWEYTPGPIEIDIQQFDGQVKTTVNEYVTYLKSVTGDINLTGNLITLKELNVLGCTITDDYSYTTDLTCLNSDYKSWLVNSQYWWTRSAVSTNSNSVWIVDYFGSLSSMYYRDTQGNGIRPTITISKEALENDWILFTIGSTTYKADNGMTMVEWIYSDYNTSNEFKTYNEPGCTGNILHDGGIYVINDSTTEHLMCTTTLTAGANYIVSNPAQ